MNLKQLYYFKHLACTNHFRKAAAELYVTQPTLSQSIAGLEEELGVKLFEKQGRNVKLTKFGEIYLSYVSDALTILERGEKEMKRLSNPEEGEIYFAFIYNLGVAYIPELFQAYAKENPDTNIYFSCKPGPSIGIIEDLKLKKFDFAIAGYKEGEYELEFHSFMEQEIGFIAPNGHEILEQEYVDVETILQYPLINYNKGMFIRKAIDRQFDSLGLRPNYVGEIGEDMALIGLVSANQGLGVMPVEAVKNNKHVTVIKTKDVFFRQKIYIVTLKNHYISPATQKFMDFIVEFSKTYN
ncbi:LysR family transcriptional regulator [Lachnospiraceae bacterium LCP25S3_G4]